MENSYTYTLGINQLFGVEHGLDVKSLVILSYIGRGFQWAEVKNIDGHNYCKLHAGKIIKDLPTLQITSIQTIRHIIAKLIDKGVIIRKIVDGNKPFFRIIEGYDFVKGEGSEISDPINIINNNILGVQDLLKEGKNIDISGLNKAIKGLTSLLEGTKEKTDLKEVSHMDIIEIWNSQEVRLWKKVNLSNPKSVVISKVKDRWGFIQRNYTKDEFVVGLENYIIDINERREGTGYADHRFTLLEFIKQSNGFEKFVQYE